MLKAPLMVALMELMVSRMWTTLNRLAMISPLETIINEGKITTMTTIIGTEEAEAIMILEKVATGRALEPLLD